MDTDELRVKKAVQRLAELAPPIDVSPGLDAHGAVQAERKAGGLGRFASPLTAAAAVAAVVIGAHTLSSGRPSSSNAVVPFASPTTPTAKVEPSDNPSIGTVAGETEAQAGLLRAAKTIETDPAYAGVVLGDGLLTAYLSSDYQKATVDSARSELGPGDQLKVVVVERSWQDLKKIDRQFRGLYSELERAGVRVGTSGIDVANNQFYVQTPDVAEAFRILTVHGLKDLVDVRYAKDVIGGPLILDFRSPTAGAE